MTISKFRCFHVESLVCILSENSTFRSYYFGAWVELENDESETIKFRIVGDEEIYGRKDYISLQSPIARACLGKSVGDEVKVQTPKGINEWYIIKIEYLDGNPPKNNRI